MKNGDKIKFGEQYCQENGRMNLLNQTIMLTPQLFEEDNGLYCYQSEAPGIYVAEAEEPDSIYHLFGEDLSETLDCEVIPATEEDILKIKKMQQESIDAINRDYEKMGEYFSKLEEGKSDLELTRKGEDSK